MKEITLSSHIQDRFSSNLGDLRELCFPGDNAKGSYEDEFDKKSAYLVIMRENELVAYGRLTPGPNSVFYTWSKGKIEMPNSKSSIDLGRCMVNPQYRGMDLLRVICILSLLYAKQKGYRYVNGTSRPGRGLMNMLEEIGYVKSGCIVNSYEPNGAVIQLQPFTCDFENSQVDLRLLLNKACDSLKSKGVMMQIHI
jgi:predicted GNAT family N-acyltransferase